MNIIEIINNTITFYKYKLIILFYRIKKIITI